MAFIYNIFATLMMEKSKDDIQMPEMLKRAMDFIHANYNSPELTNEKIARAPSTSKAIC